MKPLLAPLAAIFVLGLVLGACGGGDPVPTTTTLQLRAFDLANQTTQSRLGAPPFSPTNWQRFVGPFTAVGDAEVPDPAEVALIDGAARDLPEHLVGVVRNVVRTTTAPSGHLDPASTVAVAVGPDIYLLDRAFEGGTTRHALTYALAHELAHVHQWMTLDNAYLTLVADRPEDIDVVAGSRLVREFADAVGWIDESNDPLAPDWRVGDAVPASEYGATNPAEDMAETLALAVTGRANWLDRAHQRWVESFTGTNLDDLAAGQPWVPPGSQEMASVEPIFDEATVQALGAGRAHVEPLYFLLPPDTDAGALIDEMVGHLAARDMAGVFRPISDPRVRRWGGVFERDDGSLWWVEVWDFPTGTVDPAPDGVVVAYVMLW